MSLVTHRIFLALGFALALGASSAQAAWSTDPTNNLLVGQHTSSYQTSPQMVATPDGGFYVSWLDSGAGFSVRLQRLDINGNAMWGQNGILVFARTEQFVYDYGLDIDSAGNAVLAFDAGQPGTTQPGGQIVAMKVASDSTFPWGAGGKSVSPSGESEYLGKIAATSDGGVAVAWFNSTAQAVVQKLDAAGAPVWPTPAAFTASGGAYIADIHGSDNGNAIISYRASDAGALMTQKLASADGSPMWGANPLVLSDGTTITGGLQLGYAPTFVSDGAGGAVYTWYVVKGVSSATSRVQHVNSAGVRQFSDNSGNGVDVSTNNAVDGTGTHVQVSPSGAYDATTGDIYVVYEDYYQTFNAFAATFAQRISSAGLRQWADGLQLESYITNGQTSGAAVALPGGFIATWSSGSSQFPGTNIVATRLNADGSYAWSSVAPVTIKNSSAQTSRLFGRNSTHGYAAFVWTDSDNTPTGDVRAQNLRYDGLLGNAAGAAPGVPNLDPGSDSGVSNSDKITNVTKPLFTGTCITSGDSIGLAVDGVNVATGACTSGAYAITPTAALTDGVHTVKAFEFNANGSSPYGGSSSLTIDTTPPVITFSSTPANPTSSSAATFAFGVNETAPLTCQLDGGASTTCTSPVVFSGLAVGPHTFAVSGTDVAGNVGTNSYAWTIQPDPVVVTLDPSTDTGRSNSDGITKADPLLFTGPCTSGDSIQLYNGAAVIGAATICAGGTYSISVSGLAQGIRKIAGKATRGGVTGPATNPALSITIIRTPPPAPSITGPTGTTGVSVVISGTAAINAIVTVDEGTNTVCTALADSTGAWSCTAAFATTGTHTLTATATDVAGNTSPATAPYSINVGVADLIFRDGFDG